MSGNTPDDPVAGQPSDDSPGLPFLVVGLGASAGGLEAYTELLGDLPADPGLALLVVSHLDPTQKSELTTLLGRVSKMPVQEVTEGMAVEVDHVYVIPPGATMTMTDGHLTLTPRPPRPAPHLPIDHMLRSLAAIQRERSAGVLLSGNGTDGVLAFQAIKAAGGVTFAQDEASAQFPALPRAACLDGNVDHVMRPRAIAARLCEIAGHPYAKNAGDRPHRHESSPDDPDAVADVIALVRQRTTVDFAHYKQTTIRRRILRRMALRNIKDVRDYLGLLRSDDAEVQSLYQDFLIRVTQFFRDPEAFEALKQLVFPRIVEGKAAGANLRLWVAGCATGEEVYSLAISLLEFLDDRRESLSIKILATDLNEAALERARAGVYLDNIESDVSTTRLRRFFVRTDGHYQISKTVRELCVFSRHNMSSDPPYSRVDLVSCRNVLIYMDAALQKRVFPLLHYALNPGGFLFLGSSENVSTYSDLFEAVDGRHRIFARRQSATPLPVEFNTPFTARGAVRSQERDEFGQVWTALDVQREADRVLLNRYAPVGVVVDEAMTVLQFRGRTSAYLEPPPGMATLDLLRMLREGLLAEVRSATAQAKSENAVVVREGLQVADGEAVRQVRLEVIPFKAPPSGARFLLVLFQDMAAAPRLPAATNAAPPPTADESAARLQQEIAALREYLQSVIEQQESTNEELKSANEEILSANEELQLTNEELQTAKEEAQSANEELETVNEELRSRNAELARANSDLLNLLGGVNIPIVMIGRDLRVRRFTSPAKQLFNLIPSDIGRPMSDIQTNLDLADLSDLVAGVINSLIPYEGVVRSKDGRWYSLRIRPYVTLDDKIDGASIVLVDVNAYRPGDAPPTPPGPGPSPPPPA